jgi:hypothetical protein
MRIVTLVTATLVTFVGIGSATADEFATLEGVKATPMSSDALDAIKGAHVHFFNRNNGPLLAGNPLHQKNWYNNGSPEAEAGNLVANSYHGLCVAAGTPSGITIPPFGPGGPTLAQCP